MPPDSFTSTINEATPLVSSFEGKNVCLNIVHANDTIDNLQTEIVNAMRYNDVVPEKYYIDDIFNGLIDRIYLLVKRYEMNENV